MNPHELIAYAVTFLLGGGLVSGVVALFKLKPERDSIVVEGAEKAITLMGQTLEALERRAVAAEQRAAAAEARATAAEQQLERLETQLAEYRSQIDAALAELAHYREASA